MQKAATLLNAKLYGPHGPYGKSKKQTWQVLLFGSKAASWMMTLYPLMGIRRKEKIAELLTYWKTQPEPQKNRVSNCCSDKMMFSKGLCKSCYLKNYHKERKANALAIA